MAAIMEGTRYNNLVDGAKEKTWNINEAKSQYGFAFREVMLQKGKNYILSAQGWVGTEAINHGKELRIFIWTTKEALETGEFTGEWIFSKDIVFSKESENGKVKSVEIVNAPGSGKYFIGAFCYPEPTAPPYVVGVDWYKIEDVTLAEAAVEKVSRNKYLYLAGLGILLVAGIWAYKKFMKKK